MQPPKPSLQNEMCSIKNHMCDLKAPMIVHGPLLLTLDYSITAVIMICFVDRTIFLLIFFASLFTCSGTTDRSIIAANSFSSISCFLKASAF